MQYICVNYTSENGNPALYQTDTEEENSMNYLTTLD